MTAKGESPRSDTLSCQRMSGSILGHPVRRREDPALVTGSATFVGGLKLAGCLDGAFVRSPFAHARIRSIDGAPAAALPGVIAVLTAVELDLEPIQELPILAPRSALPADTVRFVGEPVAVVLAETLQAAADAAQLVQVEWEPLPPVLDPADGEEVRADRIGSDGDALEGAEVVVRGRFVNQRLAPLPMEPNAIAVVPDPDTGRVKVWASTQVPFGLRDRLASLLDLQKDDVRVIAPSVGGGFGARAALFPEFAVVAVMAHRLRRPVRWLETRSENFVSMMHGRGQVHGRGLGVAGSPGAVVEWAAVAQAQEARSPVRSAGS
jgi:aerobic carbon-monoxide dehydrogenase large subunit